MSCDVAFFVPGVPQPGGSKKGFVVRTKGGGQRVAIVEDAKHNASWRAVVSLAAGFEFEGIGPQDGPLSVSFSFAMPRPKSHYGTGRNAGVLKPTAPLAHTSKPDITKLVRSTEDALKGIAWKDDCLVVGQSASKLYGERPGCWIRIRTFEGGDATCASESRRIPTSSANSISNDAPAATGAANNPPAQPALFEEERHG